GWRAARPWRRGERRARGHACLVGQCLREATFWSMAETAPRGVGSRHHAARGASVGTCPATWSVWLRPDLPTCSTPLSTRRLTCHEASAWLIPRRVERSFCEMPGAART